jgi:hypothetical protein
MSTASCRTSFNHSLAEWLHRVGQQHAVAADRAHSTSVCIAWTASESIARPQNPSSIHLLIETIDVGRHAMWASRLSLRRPNPLVTPPSPTRCPPSRRNPHHVSRWGIRLRCQILSFSCSLVYKVSHVETLHDYSIQHWLPLKFYFNFLKF